MRRPVTGPKAIARRVLLMLLAVLLVAMPMASGDLQSGLTGEDTEEGCDCCSDKTPGDGEDCCDRDGGFCCATAVSIALQSTATASEQAPRPLLESSALTPPHLLLPRAQGPPPTPPPIG